MLSLKKATINGRNSRPFFRGVNMAQEWAKKFYASAAWQRLRMYVLKRDDFLCCRCGKPGKIVHHKTHLTAANINDPSVSLNEQNLETVCKDCHDAEHNADAPTDAALRFDENGNLVKRSEQWASRNTF